MNTSILLADDHGIIREGLRILLGKEPDFTVTALADNGRDAVKKAKACLPDVAILDVAMPGLNGIDACRKIHAAHPKTLIVALSMHKDSHFVVSMLQAGARAYVLKDSAFAELAQAVRAVRAGRIYLSADVCGDILSLITRCKPEPKAIDTLSPREREILQLISEGHSTKQIAMHTRLSIKTIESHRKHIMDKLKVRSIAELTQIAIRDGLSPLP